MYELSGFRKTDEQTTQSFFTAIEFDSFGQFERQLSFGNPCNENLLLIIRVKLFVLFTRKNIANIHLKRTGVTQNNSN